MTALDLPIEFDSAGPDDTATAGRDLAAMLEPGDMVFFRGEVGAGKSTMIRSAIRALGVEDPIPSPTFTIGRTYRGRHAVSHLDLYRLGSLEDEDPGLLSEYFGPDRIAFMEWPGEAEPALSRMGSRLFKVSLAHLGGDRRKIEITGPYRSAAGPGPSPSAP